jgi:hypothetical protein
VHIRQLIIALAGMVAWALPFGSASADTVLYDSSGFIQGQQSFVQSFDITTAGTRSVSRIFHGWTPSATSISS